MARCTLPPSVLELDPLCEHLPFISLKIYKNTSLLISYILHSNERESQSSRVCPSTRFEEFFSLVLHDQLSLVISILPNISLLPKLHPLVLARVNQERLYCALPSELVLLPEVVFLIVVEMIDVHSCVEIKL